MIERLKVDLLSQNPANLTSFNRVVRTVWPFLFFIFLLTTTLFSIEVRANERIIRLGFLSDIHFDRPATTGTKFGGVQIDGTGEANYVIPVQAKSAIDSIAPDYLFDAGDMTTHGEYEEFEAYREWRDALGVPVYPVMGNHDRQHNSPLLPYGTGFYSTLGYESATRVYKLGNLVLLLLSEDHHYEFNALDAAISTQKFQWIEDQLKQYSTGDNNVFIIEHYPIKETVAWSDYYYGLGGFRFLNSNWLLDWWWEPWARTSSKWKKLLNSYEDSVVAHISGHIHLPYGWRDVPEDRKIYGYGDGNWKVENVGQFVSGKETNTAQRNFPPHELPEIYFLNIRALDYEHQAAREFEPSGAVYYFDLAQGKKSLDLRAVDILTGNNLGSYEINLENPVSLGNGKLDFVSSDLGIKSKDKEIEITEDNWFKIDAGDSGWVTFQKAWNERVTVSGISVLANNGRNGRVYYRASSDMGASWDEWSTSPPIDVNVLQVRTAFSAEEARPMTVRDVKVETKQ